jgi:hypothetical protein
LTDVNLASCAAVKAGTNILTVSILVPGESSL